MAVQHAFVRQNCLESGLFGRTKANFTLNILVLSVGGGQSTRFFRQKRCLETGLLGRVKANFGLNILVLV